jgi:prepilin signal peptidase PulO-like enzyme (type II secretory pathway)
MIRMQIDLLIPILVGWIAGLFINYLADVLPATRRLTQPSCVQCGSILPWVNYLLFRRCPNGHARSRRTWIVQVIAIIANLFAWLHPPASLGYTLGMLLTVYFGIVFVIDMEHRLILHPVSIFGSLLGLWTGLTANGLAATLLGGLGGFLIMLALYLLGLLFNRLRSHRLGAAGQESDDEEALGAGDVILVTVLGLVLGWPLIWFGLLLGILLGGAVSILLVLWLAITRQYGKKALMLYIPYGPYFLISAYLILFFPTALATLLPK